MTTGALVELDVGEPAQDLPASTRWRILGYLGVLIVLMGFGAPGGGLIGVPVSFFLKNKMHLKAHQVAMFYLVSSAPVYVSFLFGFARDRFSPFGMKDRGFIALFAGVCAGLYAAFAFTTLTYVSLLVAVLMLRTAFLFVSSAQRGLMSTIGRQHVMSGQASTAWNIFDSIPVLAAYLIGGAISDALEGQGADHAERLLFLLGAAIMVALSLFAMWRPRVVYDNVHEERRSGVHPWEDVKRLVRHWPIYPALAIWLFWNFAPGSATPLQYYMQNTLHASDAQWGQWNAIFAASFIPTFMLFGYLCRKIALKHLLLWGTVVAVPQMVPLLFIHSATSALIAAVPIGLMGGVASAAYIDLLIRSCPPGLQGTTMMFSVALWEMATRFGDVLGTNLYDHFGSFTVCVIAITVVYALILPLLLLIPKRLISTADGEVAADLE